jgi:hypothetical protein
MALNYKPGERADKSKRTAAQRKKDNKGTRDGAIRVGVKGKYYNRYDAKTGTWRKVTSKTTPTWETPKPKAKPVSSGTVTSARAPVTGSRPVRLRAVAVSRWRLRLRLLARTVGSVVRRSRGRTLLS